MDSLIKNGLLITSKNRVQASIGIKDGLIAAIYEPGEEPEATEVIDAEGLAIIPGAIDMHSHHREGSETGFEYKDTIYTSTQQCAAGGGINRGPSRTAALPSADHAPGMAQQRSPLADRLYYAWAFPRICLRSSRHDPSTPDLFGGAGELLIPQR